MTESLPPLLERTAAILADSAHLLLQIEDSIAPLLARAPHSGDGTVSAASFRTNMVSLQKIDLLSQTLEDLSFWLDDLAKEARRLPGGPLSPEAAMTRLRLADLRQRLQGEILPSGTESRSEPLLF
jgi:hypothetical protein